LDLPDDLLKRAKIAAIERGVTLRELVGAAVAKELDAGKMPQPARRKIRFPILASKRPGTLFLTNSDLAKSELEEDLRRLGLPD
jgi:hypothetical protein